MLLEGAACLCGTSIISRQPPSLFKTLFAKVAEQHTQDRTEGLVAAYCQCSTPSLEALLGVDGGEPASGMGWESHGENRGT